MGEGRFAGLPLAIGAGPGEDVDGLARLDGVADGEWNIPFRNGGQKIINKVLPAPRADMRNSRPFSRAMEMLSKTGVPRMYLLLPGQSG